MWESNVVNAAMVKKKTAFSNVIHSSQEQNKFEICDAARVSDVTIYFILTEVDIFL